MTSIGYEAGFKDPSYFARAFKQLAGCTPSEYRQSLRQETPASASLPGVAALNPTEEILSLGA
ncbi:Bacterial regulatory helix-turn-helix protein, AraC family [compost metagenome]